MLKTEYQQFLLRKLQKDHYKLNKKLSMEISKPNKINRIRYYASSFFVLIAIVNLVDSFINNRQTTVFDITFAAVAVLPLLINKRLFILSYGMLAALISFPILIFYSLSSNLSYLASYLFGLAVFILAFVCSLTLIYVGTYSEEKGRFKLI